MPPVERVSDPQVGERSESPAGAPNIVLVIGCTIRRDQTSLHGGVKGTTPFLESLAAEGTTFEDVVAAAPWTKAASSAILTGYHPLSIGMIEPKRKRNDRVLSPSSLTMASHLRNAGYRTIGATANPNLNAVFGFHQGFDDYLQLQNLWREDMSKLYGFQVLQLLDDTVGDADPAQPVFLQVMFVDAHAPFDVSARAAARFSEPGLPVRVAQYRAALYTLDQVLADLQDQLEDRGFDRSNTLFVVVSDHGEGLEFPAAHGKAHGRYLYPSTLGAVWTLTGPGVPAGHRVGGVASQVDILPTLLGLAGLPGYGGPGLDLSQKVRGRQSQTGRQEAFADTWFININRAAIYRSDVACQRDFGHRTASAERLRFRQGCFQRHTDPLHERPLPNSEVEEALVQWRASREAEYAAVDIIDADPAPEVVDQLEALGYVDR